MSDRPVPGYDSREDLFRGSIGHQPFPLGYEVAKASLDRSLARLDCGYIDLMLLHQPFNDVYGA